MNYFKSTVTAYPSQHDLPFTDGSSETTLRELVESAAPELKTGASFPVNPVFMSGHSQTAWTALRKFEEVDQIYYKRKLITVEDIKYRVGEDEMPYDRWEGKGTFCIDYAVMKGTDKDHMRFCPESQKRDLPPRTEYLDPAKETDLLENERPLLIAMHGLSGGSHESYIRAFINVITKEPYNFDAMVLNARGCAHHTITAPQLFCGLWTNDLRYLINEHILKKWPKKQIFLIGFSLGGAITANYLGQEGSEVHPNIRGAAILGSPWDFSNASIALNKSLLGKTIYSPTMCSNLLRLLDEHNEGFKGLNDIVDEYKLDPTKFKLNLLLDFDDLFTSKLFGFNCALEYYRHASPDQRLLNVRVPTLILNLLDDVIVGNQVPYSEVRLNPFTYMALTSIGGHLGWFTRGMNRWYPEPVAKAFAELSKWRATPKGNLPHATHGIWAHDRIIS